LLTRIVGALPMDDLQAKLAVCRHDPSVASGMMSTPQSRKSAAGDRCWRCCFDTPPISMPSNEMR
jgi:hypothetical protein